MTDSPADDLKRTIVLIYGVLNSGGPFWAFAAVPPKKYPAFMAAYKDGSLDLHRFDAHGEVIVSGEGKSPPNDIILKVAELYQTDPAALVKSVQEE